MVRREERGEEMDAVAAFARHVVATEFDDLPPAAVAAAKMFILDTIGVGIVGSAGPMAKELSEAQVMCGRGDDARVWSLGTRLPAPAAALCNAYQIHNSEFDCVHEVAVAHVMSAVLPASLAHAERAGGVDGRKLIEAAVLGVDVASSLGVAARSGLRFFRPATVGAFGAAAAVGKLMGFDEAKMVNALSITYGQLCGTMQAHTEGSMLLAMQMGFNARNAVIACDLAAAGFEGPRNVLEGPFGFFNLFEPGGDATAAVAELGQVWRITEVAHKPFPSGRATHGVVDGCLELQRTHDIAPARIRAITARVPPLVHHLVGRRPKVEMETNYARLCAAYVAAVALLKGDVRFDDFNAAAYADRETQDLASRIDVVVEDGGDPNALTPVRVEMALEDGSTHATVLEAVYGNPAKPMTREAQLAKFTSNCRLALRPLDDAQSANLCRLVDGLEGLGDVTSLVDGMVGA